MTRPSRRHANVIRNRAQFGHNEDQLARGLGVTRETMRGWAKGDKGFADALREALQTSRQYWERIDEQVREREERERELAESRRKHGHKPHRQRDRTAFEPARDRSRELRGAKTAF